MIPVMLFLVIMLSCLLSPPSFLHLPSYLPSFLLPLPSYLPFLSPSHLLFYSSQLVKDIEAKCVTYSMTLNTTAVEKIVEEHSSADMRREQLRSRKMRLIYFIYLYCFFNFLFMHFYFILSYFILFYYYTTNKSYFIINLLHLITSHL